MAEVQELVGCAHLVRTTQTNIALLKQVSLSLGRSFLLQSLHPDEYAHRFKELTLWYGAICHKLLVHQCNLSDLLEVHIRCEI